MALRQRTLNKNIGEVNDRPAKSLSSKLTPALKEVNIKSILGKRANVEQRTELDIKRIVREIKAHPTALPRVSAPKLVLDQDPAPHVDIDKDTEKDPYAYSGYVSDVMTYYKWRELQFQPTAYLSNLADINNRINSVELMADLQDAFCLTHETLYLAINIMDRFYSTQGRISTTPKNLTLVVHTAAFIACKFEERQVPFVSELIEVSNIPYTANELFKKEQLILKTIGFHLGAPLSYSLLRRYARAINADFHLLTTARYVLEMSLYTLSFCQVSPSRMAAACLLWALRMTKVGDWNNVLWKYSGYSLEEIGPLMNHLNHMITVFQARHPKCQTIVSKYENTTFLEVAKLSPLEDKLKPCDPIQAPFELTLPQSYPQPE